MPTSLILRGGGELADVNGYSDQIVEKLDAARERGEGWLWLERNQPTDARYGRRPSEPVAVRVADVVAVSGLRSETD